VPAKVSRRKTGRSPSLKKISTKRRAVGLKPMSIAARLLPE
jgi:hypothetical protein